MPRLSRKHEKFIPARRNKQREANRIAREQRNSERRHMIVYMTIQTLKYALIVAMLSVLLFFAAIGAAYMLDANGLDEYRERLESSNQERNNSAK